MVSLITSSSSADGREGMKVQRRFKNMNIFGHAAGQGLDGASKF